MEEEGSFWHAFEASGHHQVGLLEADRLGTEADWFKSWGADFIDGCAWDVKSDSSSYGYLPGWGLSQTCPQYIAEDNFIYFFGVEVDGLKSSFHCKLSQFDSLERGQSAVEAANGCSFAGHDIDWSSDWLGWREEVFHVESLLLD